MTKFGFQNRSGIRPAVLLAIAAVAGMVAPRPATADDEASVRHVVAFAQVEAFEGAVAPATIVCPSEGTCAGRFYVAVRGQIHEYGLAAAAAAARCDGRVSLSVLRAPSIPPHPDNALRRSAVPRLSFGQGDRFDVALQPDGAGLRDVAVTALLYDRPQGMDYGILIPPPPKREQRVPLANVRVTVRRAADAAGERGR